MTDDVVSEEDDTTPPQPPEKPGRILLICFIFIIGIFLVGHIVSFFMPLPPILDARASIESDLNCIGTETGGVILCISKYDLLMGLILNNNTTSITIFKEVRGDNSPQANGLKNMGTEWKRTFAPGESAIDPIANFHIYHLLRDGKYVGILFPLYQAGECEKHFGCV